jgi:hypothetical protein
MIMSIRQSRGGQQPSMTVQNQPPIGQGMGNSDYSFTLQLIMEQQKAIGKLESAITLQSESVKELSRSIEKSVDKLATNLETQSQQIVKIKTLIYVTSAVILAVGSVLAYIFGTTLPELLKVLDVIKTIN